MESKQVEPWTRQSVALYIRHETGWDVKVVRLRNKSYALVDGQRNILLKASCPSRIISKLEEGALVWNQSQA